MLTVKSTEELQSHLPWGESGNGVNQLVNGYDS